MPLLATDFCCVELLLISPHLSMSDSAKRTKNMSGVNKVILIGNLGKDPEVRYLEGGIAVAKITLATNESHKNKEGVKIEHAEWHIVNFWCNDAETAEKYLKKGMMIYVEGKIRSRTWMDKEGIKRHSTEIEGEKFMILGSRREEGGVAADVAKATDSAASAPTTHDTTDDLPF